MHTDTLNDTIAGALYGSGWLDLPDFAQAAAADFVDELLELNVSSILNGYALDRASECADAGVPVYRSELLALLADPSTADAILHAADDLGGLDSCGLAGDTVTRLVSLGVYGVLSDVFGAMIYAFESDAVWAVLGLDDDAAEVAAGLFPEWSGTVAELLESAPRLVSEGVSA